MSVKINVKNELGIISLDEKIELGNRIAKDLNLNLEEAYQVFFESDAQLMDAQNSNEVFTNEAFEALHANEHECVNEVARGILYQMKAGEKNYEVLHTLVFVTTGINENDEV